MRVKETVLYTFDELSEEAKEKAIEKLRLINVDGGDYWHEFTLEQVKEDLHAMGFENAEIHFSGFYSQGDGACFNADVNLPVLINFLLMTETPWRSFDAKAAARWMILAENELIQARIITIGHRYSHENTRRLDVEDTSYFTDAAFKSFRLQELDFLLDQLRLSACSKIYQALEEDYEYLTSSEIVAETIRANEYEFTEDGGPA